MKYFYILTLLLIINSCGTDLKEGQNLYVNRVYSYKKDITEPEKYGLLTDNQIPIYQKAVLSDKKELKKAILTNCSDCETEYLRDNHYINLQAFYKNKSSYIGTYMGSVKMHNAHNSHGEHHKFEYYKIILNPKIKVHSRQTIPADINKYYITKSDTIYINPKDVNPIQRDSIYLEELL